MAVGCVKISPGIANQQRTGSPAAATENLVATKPRLRVFAVRIDRKPWIRQEVIRHPFPHIADHLPATKGAIPARMRANLRRPERQSKLVRSAVGGSSPQGADACGRSNAAVMSARGRGESHSASAGAGGRPNYNTLRLRTSSRVTVCSRSGRYRSKSVAASDRSCRAANMRDGQILL